MKIECTKKEWEILEKSLISYFANGITKFEDIYKGFNVVDYKGNMILQIEKHIKKDIKLNE